MAMRLSGLMSGMDTESIVEQLVLARRTKVDDTKKAQTKLQWKSEAWKTLNSKILKFYNGILGSSMRFEGSYMKKTTKVSNSSVVSVITGANAMNSVQSLKVNKLAKSGYLTGGKIELGEDAIVKEVTSDTRLSGLGIGLSDRGTIKVSVGGEEKEINVAGATTVGELVQSFRNAGINASFDATNQRFYLAANGTGTESDFSVYAGDAKGLEMLQKLGLSYLDEGIANKYVDYIKSIKIETLEKNRLNELISEKESIENSLTARIKDIEDSFEFFEPGDLDGVYVGGKVDVEAIKEKIREKIKEKYPGDSEEKLAEFDSKWDSEWKGSFGSLSRLNGVLDDLEKDNEGNYSLSESGKKYVDDKFQEMTQPFKDLLGIDIKDGKIIAGEGCRFTVKEEGEGDKKTQKLVSKDGIENENDPSGAIKDAAEDAEIYLNGVKYTSSRNTFEINGLTLTVNSTTADGEVVTLTTQDDTDGIYDMIKSFIKEYSELINEMDKLYNADSSKGYEPLTNEEKEAMTDSDIEEWEKKIKDSLLRRDDSLGSISNALKQLMLEGVTVNGKQMYLSNFGIETLSYFTAAENEKNAYHIDGDPDDSNTKANEDKLRAMIATDPQTVIDFFVGLSRNMYAEMTDRMARTEYSSAYTAYEDVKMKKEYDDYTAKIKELEKKLSDYEDKWYQKFAQMETALAKLQSSASAVTSLLGG